MFSCKLKDHGNQPLHSFVNAWLVMQAKLSGQISIIILCLTSQEFIGVMG